MERSQKMQGSGPRPPQGATIGVPIEASLEFYGVKGRPTAEALVNEARTRSRLSEEDDFQLAVSETRAARSQ